MTYPGFSDLLTPDELNAMLDRPNLVVVDMRGYVKVRTDPDGAQSADYLGARDEYINGHIPGAIYLDWTRDIIDPNDPIPVQAASPERLAEVLGRVGIGNDTWVVAYDNHPAMQFATRLWWVLKSVGHDRVSILDGGLAAWKASGLPLNTGDVHLAPQTFAATPHNERFVTAEGVRDQIGNPNTLIVDARDEDQYLGKTRRGPRGGHIPSAILIPREALIDSHGRFHSPAHIREVLGEAANSDRHVITYCNGGVAATTVLFAMHLAGKSEGALYDGSWNEWSGRLDLPVSC